MNSLKHLKALLRIQLYIYTSDCARNFTPYCVQARSAAECSITKTESARSRSNPLDIAQDKSSKIALALELAGASEEDATDASEHHRGCTRFTALNTVQTSPAVERKREQSVGGRVHGECEDGKPQPEKSHAPNQARLLPLEDVDEADFPIVAENMRAATDNDVSIEDMVTQMTTALNEEVEDFKAIENIVDEKLKITSETAHIDHDESFSTDASIAKSPTVGMTTSCDCPDICNNESSNADASVADSDVEKSTAFDPPNTDNCSSDDCEKKDRRVYSFYVPTERGGGRF